MGLTNDIVHYDIVVMFVTITILTSSFYGLVNTVTIGVFFLTWNFIFLTFQNFGEIIPVQPYLFVGMTLKL